MSMNNQNIDGIVENLFRILPVIHKKLLRMDLGGATGNLSRLHLAIMGALVRENLPISEIARVLVMPKSQMTHLVDQLVSLGIVIRLPDAMDRRIINIALTNHGEAMLKECRKLVRQNVSNKLSSLSLAELAELSTALEKLKEIGLKLG